MANLYKTASQARKILIVILAIVAIILAYTVYNNISLRTFEDTRNLRNRFFLAADKKLGDIPNPIIKGINYNKDAQFTFESINPVFPDVSYVYQIEEPREKLLSFETALETVSTLGFVANDYNEIDENNFEWNNSDKTKTLTYNKNLQKWNLETQFYENVDAIATKDLLDTPQEYINLAGGLLSRLGFVTYGLEDAVVEVQFAKLGIDGIFVNTANVSEAGFVFLNYFRYLQQAKLKPEEEWPEVGANVTPPTSTNAKVYSEDPRYGQVRMIISNAVRDYSKDIFRMSFTNYEYSEAKRGIYSIISPEEAWNAIQRGGGSLAQIEPQNTNYFTDFDSIEVKRFIADFRKTELSYFEPLEWQGFSFPIYVFKGRAELKDGKQSNFVFYVDALKRS